MRLRQLLLMCVCVLWVGVHSTLVWAQTAQVVVTNETGNIRVAPALGATVIANVPAGSVYAATGRSADSQWVRIDFNGDEGWVNGTTVAFQVGQIADLPVGDPRTIPYGGFEAPRAGQSSAIGPITADTTDWLRVRAGPGLGYPIIANAPINSTVWLTGRTRSSAWLQVNFNGTLGWVAVRYLAINGTIDLNLLPFEGVVADSPPLAPNTDDNFFGTLRLMRDRLDLAQASLDDLRARWTDAQITGRASCASAYPPRPSDFNIGNQVLAANYGTLEPLLKDFNDAMGNIRNVLDLFIQVCNQPGGGNPVGIATVTGALEIIRVTDGIFARLRNRLTELIPPDGQIQLQADECLLTYRLRREVLKIVQPNTAYLDSFNARNQVNGYCFDGRTGQSIVIQFIRTRTSNAAPFIAISPFDNPTEFLSTGRGDSQLGEVTVGPLTLTRTQRYLILIADVAEGREEPPDGVYAFVVSDVTGALLTPRLFLNEQGQVVYSQPTALPATAAPAGTCPNIAFTCSQLTTCGEAQACLAGGNSSLDPDANGNPCPNLCGGA
jgi:uncharacterized protein YraI